MDRARRIDRPAADRERRGPSSVGSVPTTTAAQRVSSRDQVPHLQRSFSVGPSDDAAEREADSIATAMVAILRSNGPRFADLSGGSRADTVAGSGGPSVSRKVADRGERDDSRLRVPRIRRASAGGGGDGIGTPTASRVLRAEALPAFDSRVDTGPRIRRAPQIGADGGALDEDTTRMLRSSMSGGTALPGPVRNEMEGAFGRDFGDVAVHTGSESSELNDRVGAKAFTVGSDIYFRDGMPNTRTSSGAHLFAHELTHVVQQGGKVARSTLGVIRREVDIKDLGKFAPGSTPKFWTDLVKHKHHEKRPDLTEAWVKKLTGVDFFGSDKRTSDDFNVLFTALTESDGEFAGVKEFLEEVGTLRTNWGGQKIFYEKPVGNKPTSRSVVAGQDGDIIRLYSAREAPQVQNLFLWARQNKIKMKGDKKLRGLDKKLTSDAPFAGHFGDRVHTVKYASQKGAGAGLVCLELTQSASNALRKAKKAWDSEAKAKGKDGGEGSESGAFGFKLENSFVSVAIGAAKATWDFLDGQIATIEFTLN